MNPAGAPCAKLAAIGTLGIADDANRRRGWTVVSSICPTRRDLARAEIA